MKTFRVTILVALFAVLWACTPHRASVLPEPLAEKATVQNFDGVPIRIFGDASLQEAAGLNLSNVPELKVSRDADGKLISQDHLVLSGGGANGAFGAGLLNGWTQAGTRPEFAIVTGVSTGAIIAPFAFLGSKYDRFLTEFYTTYSTKDLLRTRVLAGLAGASSLASSEPLAKLIERYVTPQLMAEVAREYESGRFLLVGTTNLDVQRPVIWNMGEIAKRGDNQALELFRRVIRASISIPAAFEPVLIDVTAGGKKGQELHVDGGTTDNAILVPLHLQVSGAPVANKQHPKQRMFVVLNSTLKPKTKIVKSSAFGVASRSLDTLLQQQTEGDVLKLYNFALRNKVDFNYAEIPSTFEREPEEVFDTEYMKELYGIGEKLGREGYPWQKRPKGF